MSETFGRRRGRLAAAKNETFAKLATFTLEPMPAEMLMQLEVERERSRHFAALDDISEKQERALRGDPPPFDPPPVKKKRGRPPKKKDAV